MKEKITANTEIKKTNRQHIYHLLLENDNLSRQDIVLQLRLCLPTVTQNLNKMMSDGLVMESGSMGNTGGRRATTYSVVPDARTAIGLDITKHHITAVVVNLLGDVISKTRIKRDFSLTDAYYEGLGNIVETIIKNAKLNRAHILGVGIGVPGLVSENNQRVFYGKILNFTDSVCSDFSKYMPFNAALYNDANAAGFAETWKNRDIRSCFYIMLSNNVGGAILINNHVYNGDELRSGEVGHMTIVPDGKPCYCGQKGCVDTYCAATVLSSHTDGNLDLFFEKLRKGSKEIEAVWHEYLLHLVTTVNNIRMLFDCPVILGGYVGKYLDNYVDDLRAMAAKKNTFEDNANYLKVCRFKNEAIAAGAALNFIAAFIDSI